MLQVAIEAEVASFVEEHAEIRDEDGKRRIVRNGYLPERTLLTGAGPLQPDLDVLVGAASPMESSRRSATCRSPDTSP